MKPNTKIMDRIMNLQEVMQALSSVRQSEVRYQEEKHLAMLDLPLIQTGSLRHSRKVQLTGLMYQQVVVQKRVPSIQE